MLDLNWLLTLKEASLECDKKEKEGMSWTKPVEGGLDIVDGSEILTTHGNLNVPFKWNKWLPVGVVYNLCCHIKLDVPFRAGITVVKCSLTWVIVRMHFFVELLILSVIMCFLTLVLTLVYHYPSDFLNNRYSLKNCLLSPFSFDFIINNSHQSNGTTYSTPEKKVFSRVILFIRNQLLMLYICD